MQETRSPKCQEAPHRRAIGRLRAGAVLLSVLAVVASVMVVGEGAAFAAKSHSKVATASKTTKAKAKAKSKKNTSTKSSGNLTYYFISHGCPTTTFWPAVWNGAADAGKQFGVNVKILKLTVSDCTNVSDVVNLLDTAIAAHPNGIVTTVENATSFSSALKTATHDGIPVVTMNTVPTNTGKPTATNPYLAYIGEDNYTAGVEEANEAVKIFHLAKGASVIVDDFEPTNVSLTARDDGIKAAMSNDGITPTVVNTSTTVSSGASVLAAYLTTHKTVQAVLALGPTGTSQAVEAFKSDNLTSVKLGGFDLTSTVLHYIEDGQEAFTLDQQPYLQGYDSIEELFLDSTEGAAPVTIYTGPAFLTTQNVKKLAKYVTHTGY
jgi:simple sugar transport system substrate-binding protein